MIWPIILGVLLAGYVSLGRPFAYIGLPSAHVFIGEITLGVLLLLQPRAIFDRVYLGLSTRNELGPLAWSYFGFLCYGVLQVAHGIYAGYPTLTALQSIVFHVYPLYTFAGMFVAEKYKDFLRMTVLCLGWWNCFYGLAFVFSLNKSHLTLPGTEVLVFSGVGGGSLVIIGLLSFEQRLARVAIPLMVNTFLLLAMQVRAEWFALSLGLSIWAVLSRRLGRLVLGVGSIAVLLGVGYVADFSIPAPPGRGGNISFADIVGRAVASVDAEKAHEFSSSADAFAGTVKWRENWWSAIWDSVHADTATTLVGQGYGYPLGGLVPYLKNVEIRTPHNVFFYALGYGGWLGVGAFFLFQASLGLALWRAYRVTGQPFGIAVWVMALSSSFLGNVFETPFGAIPIYLLTGAALAPVAGTRCGATYENSHGAQLVPVTGW